MTSLLLLLLLCSSVLLQRFSFFFSRRENRKFIELDENIAGDKRDDQARVSLLLLFASYALKLGHDTHNLLWNRENEHSSAAGKRLSVFIWTKNYPYIWSFFYYYFERNPRTEVFRRPTWEDIIKHGKSFRKNWGRRKNTCPFFFCLLKERKK